MSAPQLALELPLLPGLVTAIEDRLARVADAMVAGLARVRMRAKTRWGELLPPEEPGRRSDLLPTETGAEPTADRVAKTRARKLAAIPAETFAAAVEGGDTTGASDRSSDAAGTGP
jgi:hypothetical protein